MTNGYRLTAQKNGGEKGDKKEMIMMERQSQCRGGGKQKEKMAEKNQNEELKIAGGETVKEFQKKKKKEISLEKNY